MTNELLIKASTVMREDENRDGLSHFRGEVNTMSELKPCPFCGSEAWMIRTNDNNNKPYVQCKFGCFRKPKCPLGHLVTWDYDTEYDAIQAWNRRVSDE